MTRTNHPSLDSLSPEAALLFQAIKSTSLSVVEQTIRMFPTLTVNQLTVQDYSAWAYFQQEQFHSFRTNSHRFEDLLKDSTDNVAARIVRSQILAKELIRVFGDPFTTPAYTDARAHPLDEKAAKNLADDTQYRQDVRDGIVEKKKYPSTRFDDPRQSIPPSLHDLPAWHALFSTSAWGSDHFKNQLTLHFLTLPHAKDHLDQWHAAYGVHPIVQAISDANVDLVKMYLSIGVDPNLTVAVSRGDSKLEFPRSSLLSFVRDASIATALLEKGADPAKAISQNRPINLFVHWRKSFGNNPRDSDLQRKMPELQQALASHWDNPDAPIDHLIQSSGKGTGVEFKAILRKTGAQTAFQGRTILSDDTPEPTAYAAFLALNFPGKKQHYQQAKLLTESLKDTLHQPSPSGESWLFQAMTYLAPQKNTKDSKSQMEVSFESLGKTLQATTAWKLTFPSSLYAGGTRASPPPASEVHTVAKLLSHLFQPTQPLRQANLLDFHYTQSSGSRTHHDWLSEALDFSGLTWRGPSGYGDTSLSSHFSKLYHTSLSTHPDGEERGFSHLQRFATLFRPYFHFQRDSMIHRVFGSAHDEYITTLWPETTNRDGSVNRMNEIERQRLFKDHIRNTLGAPEVLKERLSAFTLDEQKAMVSFLLTRDGGDEFQIIGRYGQIDATSGLALAILKSGVLPALTSEQLQSRLESIGHAPIRALFEAAALDARQVERTSTRPTRRVSMDSAL